MGSSQSARATHFQRPEDISSTQQESTQKDENLNRSEHHINISNKMVERLVEDATIAAGGAAAAREIEVHPDDEQDKNYHEKIKQLDDIHSQRNGLTEEDIKASLARVEMRTTQMVSPDPVCGECRSEVIDCYQQHQEDSMLKCHDSIGEFTRCVQEKTDMRLKARIQRDARANALREKHLAHAREHALRDIGTPQQN